MVGQGRMGVRIASLIAYLRTSLRMPVRLIREYLSTMHNLLISTGEIVELLHRIAQSEAVKQSVHKILERIRRSPVVHGDETGWREEGQNGYVWCLCTPKGERYYEYDHSRAGAEAKGMLGAEFRGTLVSDFYAAYNDLSCEHQRCWVDLLLLRDVHELKEGHKEDQEVQEWARQLRKVYDTAQEGLRGNGSSPPSQEERAAIYEQSVEATEELAKRYANAKEHATHPCHTLSKGLLLYLEELYQFVRQAGLSADNNLAERSVRPIVVMRKVWGGTQSPRGSRTGMRLNSLMGSWRAKGLNPFQECLLLLSQPLTP
jgi:transposase